MPGLSEILRTHIDYTAWASARLVHAAGQLTPEELNRDFGSAYHTVLATLVHVFAADRVWLARVENRVQAPFVTEADHSLAILQNDWPALLQKWKGFAGRITEASAQSELTYQDLKGNS